VHLTVIQIKRVYDSFAKADGARFLVERLCPRGLKKDALHLDDLVQESSAQRRSPSLVQPLTSQMQEFQRRYRAKLADNPAAYQPLSDAAKQGNIYSAYHTEHSKRHSAEVVLGRATER
jgi:uncharacterized protein YeaO (DUF488 family)